MNQQNIDDVANTMNELEGAVHVALATRKPFIEAAPEVLDFVLKHTDNTDWRSVGYICYKGVKVYGYGSKEAAELRDKLQLGQILHGDKSTVIGK